jgi:hypothetical protein
LHDILCLDIGLYDNPELRLFLRTAGEYNYIRIAIMIIIMHGD